MGPAKFHSIVLPIPTVPPIAAVDTSIYSDSYTPLEYVGCVCYLLQKVGLENRI